MTLLNPTSGATFPVGSPVTVSATASDADGMIQQVDFYAGTTFLGTVNAEPFQVNWSPSSAGTYPLTATATDNLGGSTTSAPVNVTVTAPLAPLAPTGLSGVATSRTRVVLSWQDGSNNETGFQVQRSTGKTFTTIATLASDATGYTDSTVSANKSYSYRVRAMNAAGSSAFSNTVTVKTPR